jgi:DNA-binding NarL/FixJ family response regulator
MTIATKRPVGPPAVSSPPSPWAPRAQTVDVAVLDECPLVVHGVASMVGPFVHAVRAVSSDDGLARLRADVTLWDPAPDGSRETQQLRKVLGDAQAARLLLYSMQPPRELVEELLALGCTGFVDKGAPAEELLAAVLGAARAMRGPARQDPLTADLAPASKIWPGKDHGLSRREAEIISLIARGLTNDDISTRIYLSPNTVKSYIRSAYIKIGVHRRTDAVRWGMEQGLDLVDDFRGEPGPPPVGRP